MEQTLTPRRRGLILLLISAIFSNIVLEVGLLMFWTIPSLRDPLFDSTSPWAFMMIGVVVIFVLMSFMIWGVLAIIIVQLVNGLMTYLTTGELRASYFVVSTTVFLYVSLFVFMSMIVTIVDAVISQTLGSVLGAAFTSFYFISNGALTIYSMNTINKTQKAVYHRIETTPSISQSEEHN